MPSEFADFLGTPTSLNQPSGRKLMMQARQARTVRYYSIFSLLTEHLESSPHAINNQRISILY